MKVKKLVAVIVAGLAVLAACSSADNSTVDGSERSSDDDLQESVEVGELGDEAGEEVEPAEEAAAVVLEPTTLLVTGADASEISIAMSEQFFESSPGAVVTDEELQLEAASLGMAYAVPVLVEGDGIVDELERLDATWVITVGVELEDMEDVEAIPAVLPAEAEEGVWL